MYGRFWIEWACSPLEDMVPCFFNDSAPASQCDARGGASAVARAWWRAIASCRSSSETRLYQQDRSHRKIHPHVVDAAADRRHRQLRAHGQIREQINVLPCRQRIAAFQHGDGGTGHGLGGADAGQQGALNLSLRSGESGGSFRSAVIAAYAA